MVIDGLNDYIRWLNEKTKWIQNIGVKRLNEYLHPVELVVDVTD